MRTYKTKLTRTLSARANVAWGQSKAWDLQSGHFLLHGPELRDLATRYNLSLNQVFPFAKKQKLLLAVDVVNLFDQHEFVNTSEQSVGLGVSHANMPRFVFFRAQWFF